MVEDGNIYIFNKYALTKTKVRILQNPDCTNIYQLS